jgi:hypothetical protein
MGGAARAGRISSFMHLSGPSRVIKFLYAPASPPPTVWALKPPLLSLVHKSTYDLYSPVHNVLDVCIFITWASGRALGPGNLDFLWALNGIHLTDQCHITKLKKVSIYRAQHSPTCPHIGSAHIKTITTGLYKS